MSFNITQKRAYAQAVIIRERYPVCQELNMDAWCFENIGARAQFLHTLDDHYSWHKERDYGECVYRFFRDSDAIIFTLRWA